MVSAEARFTGDGALATTAVQLLLAEAGLLGEGGLFATLTVPSKAKGALVCGDLLITSVLADLAVLPQVEGAIDVNIDMEGSPSISPELLSASFVCGQVEGSLSVDAAVMGGLSLEEC